MADTTKQKVCNLGSASNIDFSSISPVLFEDILNDVKRDITVSIWGDRQEEAQRYLAAHLLSELIGDVRKVGAISKETVNKWSQTYERLNLKDSNRFDTTIFGKRFNQLAKSTIVNIFSYTS